MVTVSCAVRWPEAVRDEEGLRESGVTVQPSASPDCHRREFADFPEIIQSHLKQLNPKDTV